MSALKLLELSEEPVVLLPPEPKDKHNKKWN